MESFKLELAGFDVLAVVAVVAAVVVVVFKLIIGEIGGGTCLPTTKKLKN